MLGMFTFLGGITHLVSMAGIWTPVYYVIGTIKIIAAAVSLATAILILPLMPIFLKHFEKPQRGVAHSDNDPQHDEHHSERDLRK